MSDGAIINTGDSFQPDGQRHDPYRNMNFLVQIDGFASMGFKEVDGLRHSTEVITYREGGDNTIERKSPGRTTWDPISLRRGMTTSVEMYEWARKVIRVHEASELDPNFRKDIDIVLRDKALKAVKIWRVYNCWVSGSEIPTLDAMGNEVLLESLTLEHEGWELIWNNGSEYNAPAPVAG